MMNLTLRVHLVQKLAGGFTKLNPNQHLKVDTFN